MLQKEIRRLRIAKGLTQEKMAEKLHMTRHALSQLETGKREITLGMFENMLKVLDVSVKYNVHDDNMRMKVMDSHFFETWQSIEEKFPDWEVEHAGSNIFILQKEIKTKTGENVFVSVADEVVMMYKKLSRDEKERYGVKVHEEYASKEEYKNDSELYYEFEEFSFEALLHITDDGYERTAIAEQLFDELTLEDLEYHADLLR